MILGRFNPDGLVITSWMIAVIMIAASILSLPAVGFAGLLRMCAYWFGTASGLTSTTVVLAAVAFGVIRSRGWDEKCRVIASIVEEACSATKVHE